MIDPTSNFYMMVAVGGVAAGCYGLYLVVDGIMTLHAANRAKNSDEYRQLDQLNTLGRSSVPGASDINAMIGPYAQAARSMTNLARAVGLGEAVAGGLLLFSAVKTAQHVVAGEALTNTEALANGVALAFGLRKGITSI